MTVSGLLKYGLHHELSSETDDTDYEPGKKLEDIDLSRRKRGSRKRNASNAGSPSSSSCTESDSLSESTASFSDSSKQGVSAKRKKKRKKCQRKIETKCRNKVLKKKVTKKRVRRKRAITADFRNFDSSDSDSDYVPDRKTDLKKDASNDISENEDMDSSEQKNQRYTLPVKEVNKKPTSDTWANMPIELLSGVFSLITETHSKGVQFVMRCSAVCKWWREVVMQPISWNTADLEYINSYKKSNDKLLSKLCKTIFQNIRVINLSGWVHLTDRGISKIALSCPKLESINLSHRPYRKTVSAIKGETLIKLAENCSLTSISLSNSRFSMNIRKALTTVIEIRGSNLIQINFSENVTLGSWLLTLIMKYCPNLESLDLSNTSVRNISFKELQNSCPKLQELFLSNVPLEPNHVKGNSSDGFKFLETCSIGSNNNWLSDSLFEFIVKGASKLRQLDICGHTHLTKTSLDAIPSKTLERLHMARCCVNQAMISVICSKFSGSLTHLDLSFCDTDGASMDVFVDFIVCGSDPCKKLKEINLSGTSITDNTIKAILLICIDLERIDLTSCRAVARGFKRNHKSEKAIRKLRKFYV